MGRCPECGEWNTLIEEIERGNISGRRDRAGVASRPVPFSEVESIEEKRVCAGIGEFDRVLGGGIVPGSFILIGGDPGIGKSTIILQIAIKLSSKDLPVLYVSGEESESQIRMRGDRIRGSNGPLYLLAETCVEEVFPHIDGIKPKVIIIDSIQTLYTSQLQSAPGTVSQVREVAAQLLQVAKKQGITIFLIGHVTKEGVIAGPRVLEHMVDTVLYFEGDRGHPYRILRAVKNRFGAANEIGVFEMKDTGLEEVLNPSEFFLSERPRGVSGSVVTAVIEGIRPLLVEIQALATPTHLAMPRRNVIGIDSARVSLLLAILEKRARIHLHSEDIFVNVAGGVTIHEPSADLAVVAAIASNYKDIAIDPNTVLLGEVGLSGEIRGIPKVDMRLSEAAKMGMKKCLLPRKHKGRYGNKDMELIEISSVSEALDILF